MVLATVATQTPTVLAVRAENVANAPMVTARSAAPVMVLRVMPVVATVNSVASALVNSHPLTVTTILKAHRISSVQPLKVVLESQLQAATTVVARAVQPARLARLRQPVRVVLPVTRVAAASAADQI